MKGVIALILMGFMLAVSYGQVEVTTECINDSVNGQIIRRTTNTTTTTTTTTTTSTVDEFVTDECSADKPEEITTTTTINLPTPPSWTTKPPCVDEEQFCSQLATNKFYSYPDDTTCTMFIYCGAKFITEAQCLNGKYFDPISQTCKTDLPDYCVN